VTATAVASPVMVGGREKGGDGSRSKGKVVMMLDTSKNKSENNESNRCFMHGTQNAKNTWASYKVWRLLAAAL
jgi:hypothetical protein